MSTPQVEPVQHKVADPQPSEQLASVPESVGQTLTLSLEERERLRKQREEEAKAKNIFQQLQELGMNAILNIALNFLKTNWRTTVIGVGVFITTTLAKWGINLSQHEIDVIMGIGYAVIFKASSIKWDLATIVGVVLMVLSFFVNPVLGGLGIALDAGVLALIQGLLQQGVATLLKDQKEIFVSGDTTPQTA